MERKGADGVLAVEGGKEMSFRGERTTTLDSFSMVRAQEGGREGGIAALLYFQDKSRR